MINKLLVSSESSNLFTTKEFMRAGKELKLDSTWINPYDQCLTISSRLKKKNESKSLYLFRTTGIRYDDFDLNVAIYFQQNNAIISNPLTPLNIFRNKDLQQFFFLKNKIDFIPSISMRGTVNKAKLDSIKKISSDENYILKMSRGNGGIGVQIIHGSDSLIGTLETFHAIKDQRFLIQPFIKHHQEFRFLFSKSKILAIVEKVLPDHEFRANAKYAKGKLRKKVDQDLFTFAQDIFNKSELDYAGIDIITTAEGPKVLEVNCVPGFMQAQELSKFDIAKEILIELLE